MLTLGLVTDLHFGPNVRWQGKLRKLTADAPQLARAVVAQWQRSDPPALVVNLGDVIEDAGAEVDLERYRTALGVLESGPWKLVSVAGNHDCVNLSSAELRSVWGLDRSGPLYRSFDFEGFHFVLLYTHERHGVDITMDSAQLAWLAQDLDEARLPTVVLMHHSAADQDLTGSRWFAGDPHRCLLEQRRELRALLRERGRTVAVFNGHLHWNHVYVADAIPYVTLQSLVENIEDDAPGQAAAAHALVHLSPEHMSVRVAGAEPARYQFELRRT